MTKEVSSRFANSNKPRIYEHLYHDFFKLFEKLGGINIVGASKMSPRGKKIITANHEKLFDPWVMGLVIPESLFSLGKEELKSIKYAYIGRWAIGPLMNTTFIERSGRDYSILEGMADFIIEKDAAVQSFLHGTRKSKIPKTGVAHLAIRSSTEASPTPVVPYGHSTSVWKIGEPIQVVTGEPIYPEISNGKNLKPRELRNERRRITGLLEQSVSELTSQALQLHEESAGIPHKIIWND